MADLMRATRVAGTLRALFNFSISHSSQSYFLCSYINQFGQGTPHRGAWWVGRGLGKGGSKLQIRNDPAQGTMKDAKLFIG